jgi:hypothetical protein
MLGMWETSQPRYDHRHYFWACLFSLSEMLLAKQLERIQDSNFYSTLMDSSPDISGQSHVLIYVKYLTKGLVPLTQYLCTIHVACIYYVQDIYPINMSNTYLVAKLAMPLTALCKMF